MSSTFDFLAFGSTSISSAFATLVDFVAFVFALVSITSTFSAFALVLALALGFASTASTTAASSIFAFFLAVFAVAALVVFLAFFSSTWIFSTTGVSVSSSGVSSIIKSAGLGMSFRASAISIPI